jgi:V/A-type H+-transporting ATPase subunit A
MIREDFLQQSAYDKIDSFCPMEKQYWMLRVILAFYDRTTEAMGRGIPLSKILKIPVKTEIGRMKELSEIERIKGLIPGIEKAMATLGVER